MGLFGHDDEQDDRLDAIERQLRRITEQVGELSIDLGATRMELNGLKRSCAITSSAWMSLRFACLTAVRRQNPSTLSIE